MVGLKRSREEAALSGDGGAGQRVRGMIRR